MDFTNDRIFADALCGKKKDAVAEFQDLYCDELYYISSRFCNRGIPQESWSYRTEKGYTINVGDDVADTYVWLVKNIVLNKSCHFKGKNGASFESYIKAVLNSDFTFKDWLKWKTDDSLIKVPGATGYIPKCIQTLDNISIDIYKLLRQRKSDHSICNKLNLEYLDYLNIYTVIEEKLIESNQIHLISNPRISSTDVEYDSDESPDFQLSGETDVSPEKFPDFEILQSMIKTILNDLDESERKLLILWAAGYSADEIMDELNSKRFYKSFNKKININDAKAVYPFVEKQIANTVKILKRDFSGYHDTYKIDNAKMKRLLKTYFYNFN